MVLCRPCLIISVPHRFRSASFSKSSLSSPNSVDKQKGIFIEDDVARPSSSNQLFDDETPNLTKQGSSHRRSRSQYLCFGASGLSVKTPISRQRHGQSCPVVSVAWFTWCEHLGIEMIQAPQMQKGSNYLKPCQQKRNALTYKKDQTNPLAGSWSLEIISMFPLFMSL